jgi:hypothetical protein
MNLFKVDEECILQSKACPELNGDCIVTGVLLPNNRIMHLPSGETRISNDYAYDTTIKNPKGWAWAESALRKKHKPSTKSLSSMIEELNIKQKATGDQNEQR